MKQPPRLLASALLKAFAILDSSVTFKNRTNVFVDGKPVGRVPALAICQQIEDTEFLLCYCKDDWEVLGASAFNTLEAAMNRAEVEYEGVSNIWEHPNISEKDLLPEDFEPKCSFCGKPYFKIEGCFEGTNAIICFDCIRTLNEDISKGSMKPTVREP